MFADWGDVAALGEALTQGSLIFLSILFCIKHCEFGWLPHYVYDYNSALAL